MFNTEIVGKNIRYIRKVKGLTQDELAQKVGLSTMSIRRYESGDRIIPEKSIGLIADALNVTIDELLSGWGQASQIDLPNGIHIYKNFVPLKALELAKADFYGEDYHIRYQNEFMVIIVENNSTATKAEVDEIVRTYVPEMWQRDNVDSSGEKDSLTCEESALKTILNLSGYDFGKTEQGDYFFIHDKGGSVISENDFFDLLLGAKNGVQAAAKELESRLRQEFISKVKTSEKKEV